MRKTKERNIGEQSEPSVAWGENDSALENFTGEPVRRLVSSTVIALNISFNKAVIITMSGVTDARLANLRNIRPRVFSRRGGGVLWVFLGRGVPLGL